MILKQDLPNSNSTNNNLTSEYQQFNLLYNTKPRTELGDITFTSSTSGIVYDTATYNGGIYANQGQQGLLMILQDVLKDYLISASDYNSKVDKTQISEVYVSFYNFDPTGATDNTTLWNTMIAELPEGTKIKFPKGTYKGNFISQKSFDIDFMGVTLVPSSDTLPTVKFEGTVGVQRNVVGNPVYGNVSLVLDDVTGLNEGDLGYLVDDSIRPADSTPNVNTELVKIKSVDTVTKTVTVYDIIRSDQNTGAVRFYKIDNVIKNPKVKNLKVSCTNTNTAPCVWFFGCENPIDDNVEVVNSYSHAIRHEYCYDWKSFNSRCIKPSSTESGQGYGVTGLKSRIGYASKVYGIGTRHLVDFSSCYLHDAEKINEEDGKSSVVTLSHNGYGGSNHCKDATCVTDSYAVVWSKQGIADENKHTIRDVKIQNIKHIVPTLNADAELTSVYIQSDYTDVEIENIEMFYLNTGAVTSASLSKCVRFTGNQLGYASVKNIHANKIGSIIFADSRSSRDPQQFVFNIDGLSADFCNYSVWLRGIKTQRIDNIFTRNNPISATFRFDVLNGITPETISIGENISFTTTKLIELNGFTTPVKILGKHPKLGFLSSSGLVVTDGVTIELDRMIKSGVALSLVAPVGADATLNATTPFEAPVWQGQEVKLIINSLGDTGTRGNVIIPAGSTTYADGGVAKTLTKGNVYTLVAHNGKWRIVE